MTLLVETPRGYANLCRLLTYGARGHSAAERDRAAAAGARLGAAGGAERGARLPLRLRAARARASRDPNAAARLARAFGRDRFFVELQRPYERGDARRNAALRELAETLGVETVATGDAHAHHPRRPRSRTRSSRSATAPRSTAASASGAATTRACCSRRPRWPERFPTTATPSRARASSPTRLEFDLTQELGYRYPDFSDGDEPAIAQLARVCDRAFADRYAARTVTSSARARDSTRSWR